MIRRVLWVLLPLWSACQTQQAALEVGFAESERPCEERRNVGCVNFLRIDLTTRREIISRCLKVEERLDNLCDVRRLATGEELLRLDPDEEVAVEVKGLRMFPATSCDALRECDSRVIFSGSLPRMKASSLSGGAVELPIVFGQDCPPEQFYPLPPGQTCQAACGAFSTVVCEGVLGGCLCAASPDAGS